ncbi:LysR substrate-binding domain-containing protein [Litchfieldella qijiaojingensis]|uniref:LysR substrate-binding domain-containing protein n=1 Tax=Litchfieldella qijiaojingensis TaxID=980347 RepID=UPI00167BC02B|nr:LysR substrate-binding domain-containing protein [Halomonas qijiaojingensis]
MACVANGAISGCPATRPARSAALADRQGSPSEAACEPHARLTGTATASDREGAAFLILAGRYIGYLPDHLAEPWGAAGRLRTLPVDDGHYLTPFVVITRRDRRPHRVLEAFLAALKCYE